MNLKEFYNYKNLLMKEICSNKEIVKLLLGKDDAVVPCVDLPYSQVFPYEYLPETVDNAQTFICFDVDIQSVTNKMIYSPVIYIWIFTHKSKMHMSEGGILTDKISEEIDKILNGSRFFGLGDLDLKSVTRFSPIQDYQGRVLVYTAIDFNRLNPNKPIPKRRTSV